MQIIGLILLAAVIGYGFQERSTAQVSPFDAHALIMVLLGSVAAVLVSSTAETARRTLTCLRELVPPFRIFAKTSHAMEEEREAVCALWREGKRAQAVGLAEKSAFASTKQIVALLLQRAPQAVTVKTFLELRHEEIARSQPAVSNWEMLAKLGPSFGMVGTITGMIQLFRNMNADNVNIGGAMSLALVATLYGVAFGAGIAGPIGHFLNHLLDERIGVLERCETSVHELLARAAT